MTYQSYRMSANKSSHFQAIDLDLFPLCLSLFDEIKILGILHFDFNAKNFFFPRLYNWTHLLSCIYGDFSM